MKSDHVEGHSSFAPVGIIPYTLCPILPVSSGICILRSDSMVLSGHNFVRWYQSGPPSASHLCTKLGVACWMSGHFCHLALDESQPQKMNLATLGGYLWIGCPCIVPNPWPVASCLTFPSSLPPEPRLHISSITFQATVAKCILHYWNFPKTARACKTPKNLQLPSHRAGVHPAAVSDGLVPCWWTDASSQETQQPILSSICWRYETWAARCFGKLVQGEFPLLQTDWGFAVGPA